MLDLKFLLKISRPRFWIYIFGPFIVGLISGANSPNEILSLKNLIFGIYFLFPANLLIYGINDIFDYETDKLNQKKTEYETLVEPDYRKGLSIVILLTNLPFIIYSFFINSKLALAMCGFLFFSCFYSAPPIRAKAIPFLDSIFNILYVFPAIFSFVLMTENFPPILAVVSAGFWTMAMHAYSAVPDIEADKQANLQTVATKLGANGTLLFCLVCYLLSAVLAFQFIGIFAFFFGIIYAAMMIISFKFNQKNEVFKVYKFFPMVNTIVGFFLFWTIALSKFDILK
ncbi:MAG TPA: prenyltransferase [Pyrinomonadaceae bacterium]|nr:prenyltransferase [Pyrinomonadaceae bacterium]